MQGLMMDTPLLVSSIAEHAASALCYTSGTTGDPKGVLYNHRSTILHAFAAALPDALDLSSRDSVLPVVPAEGKDIEREEILAWFDGKVASWWVPDDVAFVDELPLTATGKVKKIELRKSFADYRLPD